MKNTIYMMVSHDKYELPLAVADSAKELADMCGVMEHTIYTMISHAKLNGNFCQYVRVEVDEDEDEKTARRTKNNDRRRKNKKVSTVPRM